MKRTRFCSNCEKEEVVNRYYSYDEESIYELSLCWTCNHKFRQELIQDSDTIGVLLRYGAQKRKIRKKERLAPPAKVLHVEYLNYKR